MFMNINKKLMHLSFLKKVCIKMPCHPQFTKVLPLTKTDKSKGYNKKVREKGMTGGMEKV